MNLGADSGNPLLISLKRSILINTRIYSDHCFVIFSPHWKKNRKGTVSHLHTILETECIQLYEKFGTLS